MLGSPGDSKTAVSSRWVEAPGYELFDCFVEDLGLPLPFIAEDLGVITQDVRNLKERFRLPESGSNSLPLVMILRKILSCRKLMTAIPWLIQVRMIMIR